MEPQTVLLFLLFLYGTVEICFGDAASVGVYINHTIRTTPNPSPNTLTIHFNTTFIRMQAGGEIVLTVELESNPTASGDALRHIGDILTPTQQAYGKEISFHSLYMVEEIQLEVPVPSVTGVIVKVQGGGRGEDSGVVLVNSSGDSLLVSLHDFKTMKNEAATHLNLFSSNCDSENENIQRRMTTWADRQKEFNKIQISADDLMKFKKKPSLPSAEDEVHLENLRKMTLPFYIAYPHGDTSIKVMASVTETIGSIKQQVFEQLGTELAAPTFFKSGVALLQDEDTLEHWLSGGASITLLANSTLLESLQTITIVLEPSDSLQTLKSKIQTKTGILLSEVAILCSNDTHEQFELREEDISKLSLRFCTLVIQNSIVFMAKSLNLEKIIQVSPSTTFTELKNKLFLHTGIPPHTQNVKVRITHGVMNYPTDDQLVSESFKDIYQNKKDTDTRIILRFNTPGRFRITVSLEGLSIRLSVTEADTIGSLKEKIKKETGCTYISCFFHHKKLDDNQSLAHYDIFDDAVVIAYRVENFVF